MPSCIGPIQWSVCGEAWLDLDVPHAFWILRLSAVGWLTEKRETPGDVDSGGWDTERARPSSGSCPDHLIQDLATAVLAKVLVKGSVEGLVGWALLLELYGAAAGVWCWDDFHAWLEEQCWKRQAEYPAGR